MENCAVMGDGCVSVSVRCYCVTALLFFVRRGLTEELVRSLHKVDK